MVSYSELTVVTPFTNVSKVAEVYLNALAENPHIEQLNFVFGIDADSSGKIEALLESFSINNNITFEVVKNDTPLGYAKTVNKLIKEVKTPYTMLMDSDVSLTRNCINELLKEICMDNVASVQPILVYPQTNRIQSYGHIFGPMFNNHALNGQALEKVFPLPNRNAQGITTACQVFKTNLFREVGGLDEVYYNAYEGLELSLKLRSLGYQTIVLGGVFAYHFQGKSRGGLNLNESIATAKFWSRWHSQVSTDFNQFYDLEILKKARNKLTVNCSSFEEWHQIIPELNLNKDMQIQVRARGQTLDLWASLSLHLVLYPGAIVLLCDHINQVTDNTYWFSRREDRKTIALDLHGNMLVLSLK